MLHLRTCTNCLFNQSNRATLDGLIRSGKVTATNYYHCITARKKGYVCQYYCEVPTNEKNNKV